MAQSVCVQCGTPLAEGVRCCTDCGARTVESKERICLHCGQPIPRGRLCLRCGYMLTEPCPSCGADLLSETPFCPYCGTQVNPLHA